MCREWIAHKQRLLYISNWSVFTTETKSVYCAVRVESSNIIRVNDRDQTSSGPHPTCLSPWPWAKQPECVCHSISYRNVAPLHAKVVWGNGGIDPLALTLRARQRVSFTSRPLQPRGKSLWRLGVFQQSVCKVSRTDKFLAPVRNRTTDPRTVQSIA